MTETTAGVARSNAELARAYVDDAMTTGTFVGRLTNEFGRDAVLTAANVLAVLATADAMRPAVHTVMPPIGAHLTDTGRAVLQRQLDRASGAPAVELFDQLPEHEIKVGDPDPTPNQGAWCLAKGSGGGTVCTCRPDHKLPHVMGDGDVVTAVWS